MPFRHKQLGLALLALAVAPPGRLAAQVTWSGRLGATLTTTMVTDQLGTEGIKIAPGVSPTVAFEATLPMHTKSPMDASFELMATTGTLRRTEGGTDTDLASMRTFALTGGLRGHIVGGVTRHPAGVAGEPRESILRQVARRQCLVMQIVQ